MKKYFFVLCRTSEDAPWNLTNEVQHVGEDKEAATRLRAERVRDGWVLARPDWDWKVVGPTATEWDRPRASR